MYLLYVAVFSPHKAKMNYRDNYKTHCQSAFPRLQASMLTLKSQHCDSQNSLKKHCITLYEKNVLHLSQETLQRSIPAKIPVQCISLFGAALSG